MICPFKLQQTEDMLRVWFEASKVSHNFISLENLEIDRELIRNKYIPISRSFVYEQGGRLVGFVSLLGSHIGALFVDPRFHGQGVGSALIRYVIENEGANTVDVFEKNKRAIKFYCSHGFKHTEETVDPLYGHEILRLKLEHASG